MEFTIYTFGDVEVFRAALAGVAMIFDGSTNFFVADGGSGAGLGVMAGLGMLIGLAATLFRGVAQGKIEIGGWILTLVVFSTLFVPKFSVNVEDYNGSAIAKVDGVPLGVALPAGLVSGLANEINTKLSTAYSTVEGYPTGMMTPEAITSPLKMLHSLNYGAALLVGDPTGQGKTIADNLVNLMAYCVAGRPAASQYATTTLSNNPVNTIITVAGQTQGLTMYQPDSATEASLTPCATAGPQVQADIDAYWVAMNKIYGKSNLQLLLTGAAARSGGTPIVVDGVGNVTPTPVTQDDVNQAIRMINKVGTDLSMQFVQAQILGPWASVAIACASRSGSSSDWADQALCEPFKDAVLRGAEDSAAAGGLFQRIVYGGMNILFFVWICLAPVVAMIMLIMDVRGLKIGGSYMLFGAWAVSWYVGACIINFYMLKQIQYAVLTMNTGGLGSLTPPAMMDFQDMLRMKIAMAGDLMAEVPLIMMSIMSGSVYGLVKLASKTPTDKYDEKLNAPSPMNSAPIHDRKAMDFQAFNGVGVSGAPDGHKAPTFQTSSNLSHIAERSHANGVHLSEQFAAKRGEAVQHMMDYGKVGEHSQQIQEGLRASGATTLSSLYGVSRKLHEAAQRGVEGAAQASASYDAKLGAMIGGSGQGLGYNETDLRRFGVSSNEQTAIEHANKFDSGFQSTLTREKGYLNGDSFKQTGKMVDSLTGSNSWETSQSLAVKADEAYKTADSANYGKGTARDINGDWLASKATDPRSAEALAIRDAGATVAARDPMFNQLVDNIASSYGGSTMHGFPKEALRTVATYEALSVRAGQDDLAASQYVKVSNMLTGHDTENVRPQAMQATPRQDMVGETFWRNADGQLGAGPAAESNARAAMPFVDGKGGITSQSAAEHGVEMFNAGQNGKATTTAQDNDRTVDTTKTSSGATAKEIRADVKNRTAADPNILTPASRAGNGVMDWADQHINKPVSEALFGKKGGESPAAPHPESSNVSKIPK